MISKTFDWYKIVNPTPTPQVVTDRTDVATGLLAELPTKGLSTALAMVQGIAREFTGSDAENPTLEWLLRALKTKDPAVSEVLSENKMELRCLAAITLGESITRSSEKPSALAVAAAAAFISAIELRPKPSQRYVRAMLQDFLQLASQALESRADSIRMRITVSDNGPDPTDLASAITAISRLRKQIETLNQNAAMDREETSLFWYIATAYSRSKKSSFAGMSISVAAVHAAIEVSQFLLMPPPANCYEIAKVLVEAKRSDEDIKPIPLNAHLARWTIEEADAILSANSRALSLATEFPSVFPLTWVASRIRQMASPPAGPEIRKLTGLRSEVEVSAGQLVHQLLSEAVATNLAGELVEPNA